MTPQIYVNPSCSKCRTALSLLEERGIQAPAILYLDEPPTVADLRALMQRPDQVAGDALLESITRHPILLERPIFVVGDRAVVARPPERLLELL